MGGFVVQHSPQVVHRCGHVDPVKGSPLLSHHLLHHSLHVTTNLGVPSFWTKAASLERGWVGKDSLSEAPGFQLLVIANCKQSRLWRQ